jgi:FtsH-binding integral membrane protein
MEPLDRASGFPATTDERVTTFVAYAIASSPTLIGTLVADRFLFLGLFLVQLGLVFFLSARVDRLAPGTATGLFIFYSALTGVTLSVILIAYTGASIASTFVVTAGMFGALALYGTTTSRSLAGVGQFVFMGLIGVILASVLAMFWRNAALDFLISVAGVIVFTGLTAWDAQRLRQMATALPTEKVGSYAILGALSLYLNFINLFLFMLRFMGGRRN